MTTGQWDNGTMATMGQRRQQEDDNGTTATMGQWRQWDDDRRTMTEGRQRGEDRRPPPPPPAATAPRTTADGRLGSPRGKHTKQLDRWVVSSKGLGFSLR